MKKTIAILLSLITASSHAITTTTPSVVTAATTAAIVSSNHRRQIVHQQQLINNQTVKKKLKSVGVIQCTAFYTIVDSATIYEGCDIGSWSKKYMSFEDFIAKYAPGFEVDYFILNRGDWEIYLKKSDNK